MEAKVSPVRVRTLEPRRSGVHVNTKHSWNCSFRVELPKAPRRYCRLAVAKTFRSRLARSPRYGVRVIWIDEIDRHTEQHGLGDRQYGACRHPNLAPRDLRRTCARLCDRSGGELEQIQFLLGHASVQTTERYLGYKQELRHAVTASSVLKIPERLSEVLDRDLEGAHFSCA